MYTVKVSTNFPWWPLLRQTPGSRGEWGNCRFYLNEDLPECDFWVVLDGLEEPESCVCDPRNTILVTCEPPGHKNYDRAFIRQFGAVISCHPDLDHPNVVRSQQGLPWMIGAELDGESMTWSNFRTFEDLEGAHPEKPKLLSVVASRKDSLPGHRKRMEFIDRLIAELGDHVDVFGLGYTPIRDKWDAIAPYKYHLAMENTVVADYWTEKLADAFLGEAFPIYAGCPNIIKYFEENALVQINLDRQEQSLDVIRRLIFTETWQLHRKDILAAKRQVLYVHNLFSLLARHCGNGAEHLSKKGPLRLLSVKCEGGQRVENLKWIKKLLPTLSRS